MQQFELNINIRTQRVCVCVKKNLPACLFSLLQKQLSKNLICYLLQRGRLFFFCNQINDLFVFFLASLSPQPLKRSTATGQSSWFRTWPAPGRRRPTCWKGWVQPQPGFPLVSARPGSYCSAWWEICLKKCRHIYFPVSELYFLKRLKLKDGTNLSRFALRVRLCVELGNDVVFIPLPVMCLSFLISASNVHNFTRCH